ncbi:MAG: histidine phosphatase family protein [Actinomycetes bacterium]
MSRILLVRHGQSEWNALRKWQGQADPPLSDLGRQQARDAAGVIGAVDIIITSDLQRASHTAAIISETIGVGPIVIEPRLRERSVGEWSGLTQAQINQDWPGYLAEGRRPPGFEPLDELLARTTEALNDIHHEYAGADIVIITHGGVVYGIESDAGLPFERLPNLGSRRLVHHGDRLELQERLMLIDEGPDVGGTDNDVGASRSTTSAQLAQSAKQARQAREQQDSAAENFHDVDVDVDVNVDVSTDFDDEQL